MDESSRPVCQPNGRFTRRRSDQNLTYRPQSQPRRGPFARQPLANECTRNQEGLHRRPHGHPAHFFHGRRTAHNFGDAVVPQELHSALQSHVTDIRGVGTVLNSCANRIVDRQKLKETVNRRIKTRQLE
jgi:hypothetical protein